MTFGYFIKECFKYNRVKVLLAIVLVLTVASYFVPRMDIPDERTVKFISMTLGIVAIGTTYLLAGTMSRIREILEQEMLRQQDPSAYDMGKYDALTTGLGSVIMSIRPGDGSAREQAASCQRVLGGVANICEDYATKRYRSNVINWGMVPFTIQDIASLNIQPGDQLYVPGIRKALEGDTDRLEATLIQNGNERTIVLKIENVSREERDIILTGCLINYYA